MTMARPVSAIIAAIEGFCPSGGHWLRLDTLLVELFESGSASQGIEALLRVFERYPSDEDGAEVFWAILHGLESLPGYEGHLIESVRGVPSEFGLIMIHRLLNAGRDEVEGVRLKFLLEQVAQNGSVAPRLRRIAQRFSERHKG
jgi:hypothetical protein